MSGPDQVVVIGAGIGGVAAAIAFAQQGATVEVFERAHAIEEVGAGIQISANGRKVLEHLGVVSPGPHDAAITSTGTEFRDGAQGRFVARVAPPAAGPTWYMHRADLLGLLIRRAEDLGVQFTLGQRQPPGSVQASLVIAADGAKSDWRSFVDGPCDARFTRQVAWRALVPWDGQGGTSSSVLSMGSGAHVVSYPLRAGSIMNLVAVEERDNWTEEGWRLQGDRAEFRARFAQFGGLVGEMIAEAFDLHLWALHARPVAKRWFRDNTVLLGDAAHPTLPFMAQGACLALEDACVLAKAVAGSADLDSGLKLYQSARQDRVKKVVQLATGNAWRFHMPKPLAWGAQAVLALGAGQLARRLEWVYSYDATRAVSRVVE